MNEYYSLDTPSITRVLRCILDPRNFLRDDISWHEKKNGLQRASESLVGVLMLLRSTVPEPEYRQGACRIHFGYLNELSLAYSYLHRGDYINTCNELMDLIELNPILQPRIRNNMISLLERLLEGGDRAMWFKSKRSLPAQLGIGMGEIPIDTIWCYDDALRNIQSDLRTVSMEKEEQLAYLSFVMSAIRMDLQTAFLTAPFYKDPADAWPSLLPYHPDWVTTYQTIDLDSPDAPVILSCPWSLKKMRGAAMDIQRSGFDGTRGRYEGTYYPGLHILCINRGHHHTAAFAMQKQRGIPKTRAELIEVPVISMGDMFRDVEASGTGWMIKSNQDLLPVADPRLALLFSIGKMSWEISRQETDG